MPGFNIIAKSAFSTKKKVYLPLLKQNEISKKPNPRKIRNKIFLLQKCPFINMIQIFRATKRSSLIIFVDFNEVFDFLNDSFIDTYPDTSNSEPYSDHGTFAVFVPKRFERDY